MTLASSIRQIRKSTEEVIETDNTKVSKMYHAIVAEDLLAFVKELKEVLKMKLQNGVEKPTI